MEEIIYKHIGGGKFEAIFDNGEVKSVGTNTVGMIRYTYFEDFILPKIGWEVSRSKLIEDYYPKVFEDTKNVKFEVSHIDENGIRHYKKRGG